MSVNDCIFLVDRQTKQNITIKKCSYLLTVCIPGYLETAQLCFVRNSFHSAQTKSVNFRKMRTDIIHGFINVNSNCEVFSKSSKGFGSSFILHE